MSTTSGDQKGSLELKTAQEHKLSKEEQATLDAKLKAFTQECNEAYKHIEKATEVIQSMKGMPGVFPMNEELYNRFVMRGLDLVQGYASTMGRFLHEMSPEYFAEYMAREKERLAGSTTDADISGAPGGPGGKPKM